MNIKIMNIKIIKYNKIIILLYFIYVYVYKKIKLSWDIFVNGTYTNRSVGMQYTMCNDKT